MAFEYERHKLPYVRPAHNHTYLLDFVLPNGIAIETKGYLQRPDRMKLLLVRQQHPNLDLRLVVSNAKSKVEGLVLSIAEWSDKMGFLWAVKEVPKAWLDELPRRKRVQAVEAFRR